MKSKSYSLESITQARKTVWAFSLRKLSRVVYSRTYRGSELIADEKAVFDLYCADHVFRHPHHHLLLLELLGVKHGLLLSLQLLLMCQHRLLLCRMLLLMGLLRTFFVLLLPLIQ